jgi:predicted CXXCH cytochrome family protein
MTKTVIRYLAVAAIMLMASTAYGAGIVGSAHDFSDEGWADSEICKPCHTPHNAVEASVSSRLWNHQLSTASYTLHGARGSGQGTTLDVTRAGGQADMDMGSRLCLSCHDGTVALDSFGGKTGTVMIGTERASADLGTDLSNDHPVGVAAVYRDEYAPTPGHFPYNDITAVKAAGLRFAALGTTRTGTNRAGVANSTMNNEVVSCITCHNPHENAEGTDKYLLRVNNAGSNLCLTCHDK